MEEGHPYCKLDIYESISEERATSSAPEAQHVIQAHLEQRSAPSKEAYPSDL
jgi:hypothetical protein